MKPIDDLLYHVLPFAPECPEPTAIEHLRQAAIRFCRHTRAWREQFVGVAAAPTVLVLPEPAQSQLFEIEAAWFNDYPLDRRPVQELEDYPSDTTGVPRWISEAGPSAVRVFPFEAGPLRVSVFVEPSPAATELPDFLVDAHGRALADGALSDLLMIPNQPWSQPQLAGGFGVRFDAYLNRWFATNIRGRQRAAPRSRGHWM